MLLSTPALIVLLIVLSESFPGVAAPPQIMVRCDMKQLLVA
jgi:hypothetical protein